MAEIDDLLKYLKELDGRTQLGPASEATLTRLADHFTKSSASAPKTPIEKKEQKAKEENTKQIEDVTDQLAEWELELRKNERGMYSLWTGTKMFSNQLMSGSMSVEQFASTLTTMADISGNKYMYILMKSVEQLAKLRHTGGQF